MTIKYVCGKCGAEYFTAEEAEECENSHLTTNSIIGEYYKKTDVPIRLAVKMSDGSVLSYGLLTTKGVVE